MQPPTGRSLGPAGRLSARCQRPDLHEHECQRHLGRFVGDAANEPSNEPTNEGGNEIGHPRFCHRRPATFSPAATAATTSSAAAGVGA
ncbi:hypothetical protein GCM10010123_45990 [Pilimelia anulata]|uniref:Uncharacterized protein n=1 Tax=Pilimelia anulata TaxID=53371 RepID=A0A8J3BH74_9ACTN|nr:hypothetical protein GCM10010123_45990 [Pilimelia anulata]